jgi:hypothetical protein
VGPGVRGSDKIQLSMSMCERWNATPKSKI